MEIELKDKLTEIMNEIGNFTNYQDSGAKKYAARGIIIYIFKEIAYQEEHGNHFTLNGKDEFEIKDVAELINNL